MSKIHCTNPAHQDSTPSMTVYEDGGYCFSCGYSDNSVTDKDAPKKQPEDIPSSIRYIKSLPLRNHRGLMMHSDEYGFYILWPALDYYKKRLYEGKVRYIGPRGHRPPLLTFPSKSKKLVIIEGELNAITLYCSIGNLVNIACPGSSTNMNNYITEYLTIGDIFAIVVDKDPAGVAAGVTLKRDLLKRGKKVDLICCKRDINQILQDEGTEGVRKWWKDNLYY